MSVKNVVFKHIKIASDVIRLTIEFSRHSICAGICLVLFGDCLFSLFQNALKNWRRQSSYLHNHHSAIINSAKCYPLRADDCTGRNGGVAPQACFFWIENYIQDIENK
jgi:hypothetical protein